MTKLIAITARGNPRHRETWTAAPLELVSAFELAGWEVMAESMAVDDHVSRSVSATVALTRFKPRDRSFFSYLWPRHVLARRRMMSLRRLHPSIPIIHTDTMWLPYEGYGSLDFLYRDSTINTIAREYGLSKNLVEMLDKRHGEIYRNCGGIFTFASWVKEELVERYQVPEERIVVVGSGCGPISPYYGAKNYGNGKTLFVAKVRWNQKGGRLLADGFAIARQMNPSLSLTMVAPPEADASGPGIEVVRQVSWKELQHLYREASLFALPATWEPWGQVFIEAQLNRIPIMGLNRYGFPELAGNGDYGFMLGAESPLAIAEVLLKAHSDPEKLERMGALAQKHALATHSWTRVVELMTGVIESSLSRNKG